MSCLCILELKPLSVTSFANIFSQSAGCLFVYGFLCCAKALSLTRSHLFIFAFISIAWETDLRKHWYDLCQRMFCLCSLIGVLWCLVFKPFWVYFCVWCEGGSSQFWRVQDGFLVECRSFWFIRCFFTVRFKLFRLCIFGRNITREVVWCPSQCITSEDTCQFVPILRYWLWSWGWNGVCQFSPGYHFPLIVINMQFVGRYFEILYYLYLTKSSPTSLVSVDDF